jgi:DNA-directed RNA polymerase specialized sigma subunit
MKKYSIANHNRHIKDRKQVIARLEGLFWDEYSKEDLTIKLMPLVEHIALKFSTTEQASGVLDLTDLIQEGYIGLVTAINKLDFKIIRAAEDPEKTLKSFISKRVKGSIRRAININRGTMKIPEWKLNEIRIDSSQNDEGSIMVSTTGEVISDIAYDAKVQLFFNQIFDSFDRWEYETRNSADGAFELQIEDKSESYNIDLMNAYLLGIMKKYLHPTEYNVLRFSFGLNCPKLSAVEIANFLDFNMATAIVRVSQIKREAIDQLKRSVKPTELFGVY